MSRPLFLICLLLAQKSYAEELNTTGMTSGVSPSKNEKINDLNKNSRDLKKSKKVIAKKTLPKKEVSVASKDVNNTSKANIVNSTVQDDKILPIENNLNTENKSSDTVVEKQADNLVVPKKDEQTPLPNQTSPALLRDERTVAAPEVKQVTTEQNPPGSGKDDTNTSSNTNTILQKDETAAVHPDIQQVAKNAVFTNNTEIYEVTINESWSFSGLIRMENQKVYIPLKFLPSDMLGNLIISEKNTEMVKNEKTLVLSSSTVTKRDDEGLVLSIILPEEFFKSQTLMVDKNKKLESNPISAFYTNYNFSMDDSGLPSLRGTFNTVYASKNNWLFRNAFYWDGQTVVRLNSLWQKTFSDYSGLAIGDVTDTSLTGFGSVSSLGIKYSTPYFNSSSSLSQILPTIPVSGFAVTPSKMDLFLNSQLIQQKEVASGRYSLEVPYQSQGYGVFQAYVYDINGKPNVVSVPFYSNNEVVKKGAREYSVTAGLLRKDSTTSSTEYDKPYVSGIFKGGIANNYTQDLYFQYSPYYSAVSGLAHVIPYPKFGMFNLGYSINSEKQSLYKLGWERSGSSFSVGAEYQKAKDKTEGFCLGLGQSCITEQKTAFIGASLPRKWGGVNFSYVSRFTSAGENQIASLQWNKQFNKYVNVFSSLSSTKTFNYGGDRSNNKVLYVGLSFNFDGHLYTNSSYTRDKNGGPNYQQSFYRGENPAHPEYGYGSLTINKTSQNTTQNLYYGARLNNFAYQVNSYRDDKGIKTNLSVDGALSYIPEENYFKFSKSMNGGLVFVKIENLTIPAEISHENRFAGMSDNKGRFLVSEAVALNNENISININKLPKSITLEENKKQFYIPFSGAVRVDFKSKPLPYIIKIKGAPTGAIFELNKEYYVIGDKGNVSVEAEGNTQIPLDGGGVCDLTITKKQKEYNCATGNVSTTKKEETAKEQPVEIIKTDNTKEDSVNTSSTKTEEKKN